MIPANSSRNCRADLKHPPHYVPELLAQWRQGYEVVPTRRVQIDKQPFFCRLGSRLIRLALNSLMAFSLVPLKLAGSIGLFALSVGHIRTEFIHRPPYLVRKQVGSGDRRP
jgi:hypothetical protein